MLGKLTFFFIFFLSYSIYCVRCCHRCRGSINDHLLCAAFRPQECTSLHHRLLNPRLLHRHGLQGRRHSHQGHSSRPQRIHKLAHISPAGHSGHLHPPSAELPKQSFGHVQHCSGHPNLLRLLHILRHTGLCHFVPGVLQYEPV